MSRTMWRSALLLAALSILFSALTASSGAAPYAHPESAASAASWLVQQQRDDGGFPGFDGESDPGTTADTVVALASVGIHAGRLGDEGASAIDYLEGVADSFGESQAGAAKLALAARATGGDPRDFGGIDLIGSLVERADPASGWYDDQLYIHAFVMLAVAAAGDDPSDAAVDRLIDQQIDDGSWAFAGAAEPGEGDTNTTSIVIQALVASGQADHDAVQHGLDYLLSAQTEDGSIVYAIGAEDPPVGDANSTALAVQAMLAAGLESDHVAVVSALDALIALQNDSGALGYRIDMPDDNALATVQALPALALKPFPVDPYPAFAESYDTLLGQALDSAEPGDDTSCDFFDTTGHNLCNGFRSHWWANGGLAVFGYPLTEEFDMLDETGARVTIQYFERARFEYRGLGEAAPQVAVAPLGLETVENANITEILDIVGPCERPAGSGHGICGVFLDYWQQFGGEDVFGLPVSDAFGSEGMTVQYFENARFEHQPNEWPERLDVLLGRIGAEVLREQIE